MVNYAWDLSQSEMVKYFESIINTTDYKRRVITGKSQTEALIIVSAFIINYIERENRTVIMFCTEKSYALI